MQQRARPFLSADALAAVWGWARAGMWAPGQRAGAWSRRQREVWGVVGSALPGGRLDQGVKRRMEVEPLLGPSHPQLQVPWAEAGPPSEGTERRQLPLLPRPHRPGGSGTSPCPSAAPVPSRLPRPRGSPPRIPGLVPCSSRHWALPGAARRPGKGLRAEAPRPAPAWTGSQPGRLLALALRQLPRAVSSSAEWD